MPCIPERSMAGMPCPQGCALPYGVHIQLAYRVAHLGEGVVGVARIPLRAELEVVAAGLIVIDPEVAAERDRTRTRESQVEGELGRGPPVLVLQVDLSDGGSRGRIVGRVANRGTVLLGEVDRDGEPFSVHGGCHVGEARKDLVARVTVADTFLDPVNFLSEARVSGSTWASIASKVRIRARASWPTRRPGRSSCWVCVYSSSRSRARSFGGSAETGRTRSGNTVSRSPKTRWRLSSNSVTAARTCR